MAKKKKVTAVKQKKIILTIRATKTDEINTLNNLKAVTMEKTYAGAMMKGAKHYPESLKEIVKLKNENTKMIEQIRALQSIFDKWISSKNEMENVAQKITKQVYRPYPVQSE